MRPDSLYPAEYYWLQYQERECIFLGEGVFQILLVYETRYEITMLNVHRLKAFCKNPLPVISLKSSCIYFTQQKHLYSFGHHTLVHPIKLTNLTVHIFTSDINIYIHCAVFLYDV